MHRFYVQPEDIKEDNIVIKGREAKHAFLVSRLRIKDEVMICDGKGRQFLGIVQAINSDYGIVKIKQAIEVKEDELKFILAQAIPKKAKFDDIVDKATQLGVSRIIPVLTQRTIVRIPPDKQELRRKRWQKVAVEAAKQCGTPFIPLIEPVTDFTLLLKKVAMFKLGLIACCQADNLWIKDVVRTRQPKQGEIIVFIGPEGDFTAQEVKMAEKNGCLSISLGKNILRCDTAAGVILTILNYEWKN